MSTPRKRSDAELWRAIEDVAAHAQLSRIETLSEEEVDRELRAAGIEPGQAAKVGQGVVSKQPVAERATSAKNPRKRAMAWATSLATGAAIALGIAVVVKQRVDVRVGAGLQQHAAALREQGLAACAEAHWVACEEKLDAARALDAGGENDGRVLQARQALRAWHARSVEGNGDR
ncbi:MAG TPA: hypothetical protein VGY54_03450 [Polyangiaceae bacterium]|nr:hypothetical protein [Polyangiaceae bacterium]